MSTEEHVPLPTGNRRRWKRGAAVGAGVAVLAGAFATNGGPINVSASSHREAPLISGDPRSDNTDVYAFVSPDDPNSVTLIANWIPFEEPNGGPNFYTWADGSKYTIKIDSDGDAKPDLTYTWIFDTTIRDANGQFLSNTGQVTSLTDPDLNVYQTYDLTVTNKAGVTTTLLGNGDGVASPGDPISAPSIAGAASMPDYTPLRDQAIYAVGGGKTFAGQADDPFFLDLRVFDLLYGGDASELGEDTLAGYNVNTVALQLPKSALALNGNATTNPVIGIWSTTETSINGTPGDLNPANFKQVSRLGNPLVNEVVIPLSLKDAFNAISPDIDSQVGAPGPNPVVAKVEDPILPKLIQAIYGVPAPATPRNDLTEIFLQGISKANAGLSGDPMVVLNVDLNAPDLNGDASASRGGAAATPSEMLRLNMSIPSAANPNRYGVLAGDIQGFPNGRRLTDDVVDIAIQAVEGAAQSGKLVAGLAAVDSVDRNDRAFGTTFPYLALPHVDSVNNGTERTPRAPEIISVNPSRILDTRSGTRPAGGSTTVLKVTGGAAQVPADATTVFLNVTATNTSVNGFVTVYPCGSQRPLASNFNPIAGIVTQNLVAAKVGTDGNVCIFTSNSTDLVADVNAYHPFSSEYKPLVPERLLETRSDQAGGQKGYAGARPAGGSTIMLKVTGTGTANLPADTKAVLLNVTSVNSAGPGWITVYPCGSPRPVNTSNINLLPGLVRANLVAAKVGADGNVCLFVSNTTDVVADLEGAAPFSSTFVATVPERVLETRTDQPGGQINYSASRPKVGQTTEFKVIGFGTTNMPTGTGTVFLNVTAVDPAAGGYVTAFPCGSPRPLAANIDLSSGVTTPNMVAVKVGDGGRVCLFTSGSTDLIADILGYFPGTVLAG
ncbi:MAG: DUF4331 domain-containing protein [Ilumatobacteraceae bacterium]